MTNTNFIGNESSINVHDSLTPYMGYKVVGIVNPETDKPVKMFGPHYTDTRFHYENMTDAHCDKRCGEGFAKCSCGFYAYEGYSKTYSHWVHEAHRVRSFFIAQIAFSGTTVICEDGARGKVQRIVKLFIPCCWNCEDGVAATFIRHEGGTLAPACQKCVDKLGGKDNEALMSFDELSKLLTVDGFKPVKIIPAPMGGLQKAMESEERLSDVMATINRLIQDGDVAMLSQISNAAFNGSVSLGTADG